MLSRHAPTPVGGTLTTAGETAWLPRHIRGVILSAVRGTTPEGDRMDNDATTERREAFPPPANAAPRFELTPVNREA